MRYRNNRIKQIIKKLREMVVRGADTILQDAKISFFEHLIYEFFVNCK